MAARFDIVFREARIIDGSGGPASTGDVAIAGDRIERVGESGAKGGVVEIDARAWVLAPGFIDVHTHDDFAALVHPDMAFKLEGGVTTVVVGNCGFGAAPFEPATCFARAMHPALEIEPYEGFAGYFERLGANPPGTNVAALAGHGTLRMAVMGSAARAPAAGELEGMKSLLREALDAGAAGLSTGLIYEPGRHAATEEIIELAREMRGSSGVYATHMRDEGEGLLESVREAIAIGAGAGVPVQISHHKAAGRESCGLVADSLRLIEAAQGRGLSVHADQYPYTAGSTVLKAVLENDAFLEDPPGAASRGGIGRVAPEDVVIASAATRPQWQGRSVAALAAELGLPARAAAERVEAEAPGATVILHMMSEADVQRVLAHPSTMIGSDGLPTLEGRPHPRLYNTFTRVLGHYARDLGVLPLETAVHRMTGFPAAKFSLAERGRIQEGYRADLVAFDAGRIIDQGTFEEPNRRPSGIEHVLVNGRFAVRDGRFIDARGGRVLRREGGSR